MIRLLREKDVEVCKARRRKVSRRLDENWQNEYTPSHEKAYALVSITRYLILFLMSSTPDSTRNQECFF